MGAWGYELFDNDLSLGVKDVFLDNLMKLNNNKTAFEKTMKDYEESLDQTEVIMPLAYLAFGFYHLSEELKQKTIDVINDEICRGLTEWERPEERKRTLCAFREFISSIKTYR